MRKLVSSLIILVSFGYLYCQWARTYGGPKSDVVNSIIQTSDGGFLIAATTYSFGLMDESKPKIWLIKINAQGEVEWEKAYGTGNPNSIFESKNGGNTVGGTCDSAGFVMHIDNEGEIIWQNKIRTINEITELQAIYQEDQGLFCLFKEYRYWGYSYIKAAMLSPAGEIRWGSVKHFV